jgi:hypothetical protein
MILQADPELLQVFRGGIIVVKNPPMRVHRFEREGGSVIKSGGERKNVPTGRIVKGTTEGGAVGTGPPGGGGGGGPTVTTARARARTISGYAPHGGEDFAEGGSIDITAEEQEALAAPSSYLGGPSGGQSSIGILVEWLTKDSMQRREDEATKLAVQRIDQDISNRLKTLEYMTIALQSRGDIAYAQIEVRKTTTKEFGEVFDLKSVAVSDWYRQGRKDESGGALGTAVQVQMLVETKSFAQNLLPWVRVLYAHRLANEIATADAPLRPKLQDCLRRLEIKGPHVPAFSFLGGGCDDTAVRRILPVK